MMTMNTAQHNTSLMKRIFAAITSLWGKKKSERTKLLESLRESQKQGLIDMDALIMIEGVFQVSEMRVRDIMVPRSHMVVIQEDQSVEKMLSIVSASGHSRFPVIDESLDEIVGILLAKDLAHYSNESSRQSFELKDILRPAVFVPESKRLNVLLKDFRTSRNHMAIVIDEYSGVAGLVTIEDVLEQIVGQIDDEHDAADAINIHRHGFHRYTLKGVTPIAEFNAFFGTDFSNDQFDTVAGLILNELGHMPERGEEVTIDNYQFKIISSSSRRINNLQITLLPETRSVTSGTA
jgi:magnesium and cobalt transporter